eukprot:6187989-Pleurochrysis_carterae.AAC.2
MKPLHITVYRLAQMDQNSHHDRTSFSCPGELTFAYGARPSLREWGERRGYMRNPVELAIHRLCGVRDLSPSRAFVCDHLE